MKTFYRFSSLYTDYIFSMTFYYISGMKKSVRNKFWPIEMRQELQENKYSKKQLYLRLLNMNVLNVDF